VRDDVELWRFARMCGDVWMRFSRDGRFFAAWGGGHVIVWKLTQRGPLLVVNEHRSEGFDFSPDSRRAALDSKDGSIRLFDLTTGKCIKEFKFKPSAHRLSFHPSKELLAVAYSDGVLLIDLTSGKSTREIAVPALDWLAWSPQGDIIATASNRTVYLCDASTGRQLAPLEGHRARGIVVAFNHDGSLLASSSWDGTLRLWDPRTSKQLLSMQVPWDACLEFGGDGRLPLISENKLQLWNAVACAGYLTLEGDRKLGAVEYAECAASPQHDLLAASVPDGVVVWNLGTGRPVKFLPKDEARSVRFEPSGSLLVNWPGGVERFPVTTDSGGPGLLHLGAPEKLPLPGSHHSIALSKNGDVLANAQAWGAFIWDQKRSQPPIAVKHDDARFISVSPDGRWVATGSHSRSVEVKVWDAESGKLVQSLPVGFSSTVNFSPDGTWLGASGGGLRLWHVPSWTPGPRIGGTTFAFSPDGQILAVETGSGTVRLVAPANGQEFARLEDPDQDRATYLTFTSDGSRLVVLAEQESLHIYDLRSIREQLAQRGLDWDLPPYPPAAPTPARVRVE
jgi:WD40 repeat protein